MTSRVNIPGQRGGQMNTLEYSPASGRRGEKDLSSLRGPSEYSYLVQECRVRGKGLCFTRHLGVQVTAVLWKPPSVLSRSATKSKNEYNA